MRKKLSALLGLVMILSMLPLMAFADSGSSIAGTWLASPVDTDGTQLSFELRLNKNGTFRDSVFVANSGFGFIREGTYTVSGNRLTMKGIVKTGGGNSSTNSNYEFSETFILEGDTLTLPKENLMVTYTRASGEAAAD